MTDDILIIDNFVPKILQNQLEVIACENAKIDYYFRQDPAYNDDVVTGNLYRQNDKDIVDRKEFVFTHDLFTREKQSAFYKDFQTIPNKILKEILIGYDPVRFRIVLSPPLYHTKNKYGLPHIDDIRPKMKSAIYYISDSDGDTILFEEVCTDIVNYSKKTVYKRVSPKKGRLLVFDSNRYHANSWSSEHKRVIINMIFQG